MERFEGFPPRGLRFLRDLAKHNDRVWFMERKHIYEEDLLLPMQRLVNELSTRFERKRIPVYGDLRRSIFRIYRDVRFSRNKLPYKTHFAAYLSPDGGRHTPGGLYIHITPKDPFLSLAFYDMHPKLLQRWRMEMAENPKGFTKVVRALRRTKLGLIHPDDEDDSLQRMPRGFTHLNDTPLATLFSFAALFDSRRSAGEDAQLARARRALRPFRRALLAAAGIRLAPGCRGLRGNRVRRLRLSIR